MISRRSFLTGFSFTLAATAVEACGQDSQSPPFASTPVSNASSTLQVVTTDKTSATSNVLAYRESVVLVGDSIGYGEGSENGPAFDKLTFSYPVRLVNLSVSGRTLRTGYEQRNTAFSLYQSTCPSVLIIQQGTNDLGSAKAATELYADVATPFIVAAKAAGFYVVIQTVLPRSDANWSLVKEEERKRYNDLVRLNTAQADYVVDIAADPSLGDAKNPSTSGYYTDGLHPNAKGQKAMSAYFDKVISLFSSQPVRPQV